MSVVVELVTTLTGLLVNTAVTTALPGVLHVIAEPLEVDIATTVPTCALANEVLTVILLPPMLAI